MRYAQSFALILAFGMLLSPAARCAQPPPTPEEGRVLHWSFDGQPINGPEWHGEAAIVPGVRGDALGLDGATAYAAFEGPTGVEFANAEFSVSVWVNPYVRTGGQQMVLAKSVYALNQREWSLLLEPDGRAGFYLRRDGWLTATSEDALPLGHWSHLVVSVGDGQARLFVNGHLSGHVAYQGRGATTDAPISVGGLSNDGDLFQMLRGAIDEVAIYDRPLSPAEIEGMYQPVPDTHPVPEPAEPIELWDPRVPFPEVDTIPLLDRVTHVVVHRATVGEYEFLHGAAIIEHDGVLHATWANSPVEENSAGEIQRGRRSSDGGLTWGPPEVIAPGFEGERRHSHGVLAERGGELWAFAARFGVGEGDTFRGLQTEAFVLDGDSGEWVSRGIVMGDCWPYDQPKRLPDGSYITGGQDSDRQPCVAISHGDDFTNWDTVKLPVPQ
ncbi:MAG: hypothetical protein GF320_11285, partial [Armatimonadia bacterium]|nr:hypothetical protein [Armatimonadia bacterium]